MELNMLPTFSIFLGDAKTMFLKLVHDDCCGGTPVDLTFCTEIKVTLLNQDGTFTVLLLSASQVAITVPAVLGQFSVPISTIVSAVLNVGEFQPVDVTLTISSPAQTFTVRFEDALSVFEVS